MAIGGKEDATERLTKRREKEEREREREREIVKRQVPTLKQASPLRVSPERRLVLDCRRHEIACVWMAEAYSARLGSARDLVVRLSACPHHVPRRRASLSSIPGPSGRATTGSSGSPVARELALKYATLFIYLFTDTWSRDRSWISRQAASTALVTSSSPLSLKNTGFREGSTLLRRSSSSFESLSSLSLFHAFGISELAGEIYFSNCRGIFRSLHYAYS